MTKIRNPIYTVSLAAQALERPTKAKGGYDGEMLKAIAEATVHAVLSTEVQSRAYSRTEEEADPCHMAVGDITEEVIAEAVLRFRLIV